MSALDLENEIFQSVEEVDEEILRMTADEISRRTRLLENEIRVLKDESTRLSLDLPSTKEKVKDNKEKIKFNKQLPYLVGNIVEILDANAEDEVRKQKTENKNPACDVVWIKKDDLRGSPPLCDHQKKERTLIGQEVKSLRLRTTRHNT